MNRLIRQGVWALAIFSLGATAGQPCAAEDQPRTRDLLRVYIKQADQPAEQKKLAQAVGLPDVEGGVVALEYSVLLVNGGKETPVPDPDQHEFQIGDEVRVQIQPLVDVYIYIFHEGPSGQKTCLLPQNEETSPLAKSGKKLVLPDDGAFRFTEPAGAEKLIVVAAKSPNQDLALLSNVVFKKEDAELTADERQLKSKLSGTFSQMLNSVRDESRKSARHRGLLDEQTLKKFAAGQPKTRTVIEEPPSAQDKSSFAMAAHSRSAGRPELFVSIPLKSVKAAK